MSQLFISGGQSIGVSASASAKATLWVKAQHEGALPPPCIVRKDPRVPHPNFSVHNPLAYDAKHVAVSGHPWPCCLVIATHRLVSTLCMGPERQPLPMRPWPPSLVFFSQFGKACGQAVSRQSSSVRPLSPEDSHAGVSPSGRLFALASHCPGFDNIVTNSVKT